MEILSIKNLSVTYRSGEKNVKAVDGVSAEIHKGDSLGIVGESGSGKSTLALAILRMHDPRTTEIRGKINFQGEDIVTMAPERLRAIRWKEMSVVFQKSMNNLSPVHKIGTQFEDIYRVHEPKAPRQQIRERVMQLFRLVNLAPRVYNLYPHELSGGMLQRISIALSLVFTPKLLIMDEATTALDVVTQGQILHEIHKLEEEISVTRIMITHDLSVVATSCKKIVVMYAGKLMEFGYVKDVLSAPKHPYTQGLVHSFPSLHGEKTALQSIPGTLPDLTDLPKGCVFAPRCKHVMPRCLEATPADTRLSDVHKVACYLYEGGEGV